MKNSVKISVLGACMFLSASVYSQSDSLGMPGDNLDLNAVLSIFKQSSSVEDFEKRLNSADTKVNNIDLNNDNQVDYLRVVDYGKDDFHSLVIQDPISKTETQDVAVIEVVKKGDNTAHIQIVGDETLYGKNYIIEPENQAPLATSSSNNSNANNNNTASDDVYASQNSSSGTSQVMINVWGWPSVGYLYSPGYAYYSSPWYYGYYPGWFMPWRPYGWYAYHSGWMGYNYGFYGYRRNYYAFPHVHNYYYGHRMQSGYVQKNAANYGRRTTGANYNGGRTRTAGQPRNTGTRNQVAGRNSPNRPNSATAVRNRAENNRVQSNNQQRQQGNAGNQRNTNQRAQNNGGQRVSAQNNGGNNGGARSNGGGVRMDNGGGGRMNGGGGGGRMSGGGGGGGRMSGGGGGGGHMGGGGGGGHMGGGGGHGGGGGGHR